MTSYTVSKYPSLIFKVMVSSGYIGAIIAFLTTLKLTKLHCQIIGAISIALKSLYQLGQTLQQVQDRISGFIQ